jgi:hypothetical protein
LRPRGGQGEYTRHQKNIDKSHNSRISAVELVTEGD